VSSSTTLWYLTRGSGAVALVLLTGGVVLGILSSTGARSRRWPRFAVGAAHRNLTLLSLAFVALHVVTTVADGYAPIGFKDAIVPFASPYRPLWLGLGTVAVDLLLALAITSYLRQRIGSRTWRAVHWLAYASWPVALVHSLGTGSDARVSWLTGLAVASILAVALAVVGRALSAGGPSPVRLGALGGAILVPLAIAAWYEQGPAKRGWAARAGTPVHLRASVRAAGRIVPVSTPVPPRSFTAPVKGSLRNLRLRDGRVRVVISLRLAGAPGGAVRLDLRGQPVGNGVSLDASGISFVPATTRAVYLGSVTGLDGNLVEAHVRDASGDNLDLTLVLSLDAGTGAARGVIRAVTAQSDDG
jgi:DMSO/TMAO reductase YedYZ heme-binding membrane subunit